MKSVLIASREILLWEMWHLFFILGLSLRFSSKIKQQLLNITAISVWCSTGGCRHCGVHFCAYVFISCVVPCVIVCLLCVRPAGFYRQNAFFPYPPTFCCSCCHSGPSIFWACWSSPAHSQTAASMSLWRHWLLYISQSVRSKGCQKVARFLFITWKVNPCLCVSLFISVVCVSCNITVGKNRKLEWKDKPQQTILSIVKNKTCHMPHTSPTVYEKKVPWVFPKDQKSLEDHLHVCKVYWIS